MWRLVTIATLCGNVNTYHEIITTICGIEVFLMSNQADHTIVRLRVPPELKQKIEESADKNNRSQSAEMVARLEESFTRTNLVASDPYKRMLLANVAMIVANEADNPNPSFAKAMERITKAIMVDEKHLFDIYKDTKKAP